MPIAFVQSTGIGHASSSVTIGYAIANTAGNLLIAAAAHNSTTPSTIVDSAGNTWLLAASNTHVGINQAVKVWHVLSAIGSTNSVTLKESSGTLRLGLLIYEYSGLSPTLGSDTKSFSTGTSTLTNSGNIATTMASQLLFGMAAFASNTNGKSTNNDFDNFLQNTTGRLCAAGRIVTSTASTYAAIFNTSGATPAWGSWIVSYQTDAGAAAENPDIGRFTLLGVQ